MAAGLLIMPQRMPARDWNGRACIGHVRVYANLTTDEVTVYTDASLTIPLEQPIDSNASGVFPAIWYDSALGAVTMAYEGDDGQTQSLDNLTASSAAVYAALQAYSGAIVYGYSSATVDTSQGVGKVWFDAPVLADVEHLYASTTDADGNDVAGWLESMDDANDGSDRGSLMVRSMSDASAFGLFKVTGPVVDGSGYRKIPVVLVSGAAFTNLDNVVLGFSAAGAQGNAATITPGAVTILGSTATPTVVNAGDEHDALFNFGIPAAAPAGIPYAFDNATADADPGVGKFRLSSATLSAVNYIYISKTDAGGSSQDGYISTWDDSTSTTKGDTVLRQVRSYRAAAFTVTGSVVDATTYYKVPVTWLSGDTLFTTGAEIGVGFNGRGNKGQDGTLAGPGSSTDNYLALWNGSAGTTLKVGPSLESIENNDDVVALALELSELKGSLVGLASGWVDAFEDSAGVDAAGSTNESYDSTNDLYQNTRTTYSNAQPAQTAASSPAGYAASATSETVGAEAWKAFDQAASGGWQASAGLPQSLKRQFPSSRRATAYTITGGSSATLRPTAWVLEGSNDDSAWTTLDTQTGQTIGTGGATYSIASPAGYLYYRLRVTAINGGTFAAVKQLAFTFTNGTIYDAMSLRSVAGTALAAPVTAKITVAASLNGGAINTDLIAYASRNGGTIYTAVTLTAGRTLADGTTIYDGVATISAQPSGTSMKWRIDTTANYGIDVSGVGLQWNG